MSRSNLCSVCTEIDFFDTEGRMPPPAHWISAIFDPCKSQYLQQLVNNVWIPELDQTKEHYVIITPIICIYDVDDVSVALQPNLTN